jgi:hypothetical protein
MTEFCNSLASLLSISSSSPDSHARQWKVAKASQSVQDRRCPPWQNHRSAFVQSLCLRPLSLTWPCTLHLADSAHTPPTPISLSIHVPVSFSLILASLRPPQIPFPDIHRSSRTIFPPTSIIRTTNHQRRLGQIQPHRTATATTCDYCDRISATCCFQRLYLVPTTDLC